MHMVRKSKQYKRIYNESYVSPLLLVPSSPGSLSRLPLLSVSHESSRYILCKPCICKYKWVYVCTCVWISLSGTYFDENKFTFPLPLKNLSISVYLYPFLLFFSQMAAGYSLCFFHLTYLWDCVIIHLQLPFLFYGYITYLTSSRHFRCFQYPVIIISLNTLICIHLTLYL